MHHSGINYNASLSADNKTSKRTAFIKSDEDQQLLNELNSFQNFQTLFKASGPESPPKQ